MLLATPLAGVAGIPREVREPDSVLVGGIEREPQAPDGDGGVLVRRVRAQPPVRLLDLALLAVGQVGGEVLDLIDHQAGWRHLDDVDASVTTRRAYPHGVSTLAEHDREHMLGFPRLKRRPRNPGHWSLPTASLISGKVAGNLQVPGEPAPATRPGRYPPRRGSRRRTPRPPRHRSDRRGQPVGRLPFPSTRTWTALRSADR